VEEVVQFRDDLKLLVIIRYSLPGSESMIMLTMATLAWPAEFVRKVNR
jgi:hypothetical protein